MQACPLTRVAGGDFVCTGIRTHCTGMCTGMCLHCLTRCPGLDAHLSCTPSVCNALPVLMTAEPHTAMAGHALLIAKISYALLLLSHAIVIAEPCPCGCLVTPCTPPAAHHAALTASSRVATTEPCSGSQTGTGSTWATACSHVQGLGFRDAVRKAPHSSWGRHR